MSLRAKYCRELEVTKIVGLRRGYKALPQIRRHKIVGFCVKLWGWSI